MEVVDAGHTCNSYLPPFKDRSYKIMRKKIAIPITELQIKSTANI
jgi:hypothetical protein